MKVVFWRESWRQYREWREIDDLVLQRLDRLIEECQRTPFQGTGKPEPLKGDLQGWWSRRLTKEDRLVYRVAGERGDQRLEILTCRYHS